MRLIGRIDDSKVIPGAIELAGFGLLAGGLWGSRHNAYPYGTVTGLSDTYNAELRQRILRGEVR